MLLFAFGAWAKQRTAEQARALARTFLAGPSVARATPGGQQDALTLVYTATGAQSGLPDVSYYYVFDRGGSRGFVIVASDDRAKEVLGYAEGGSFNAGELPANFKYWLSMYEKELELLARTPESDLKITPPQSPPVTRTPAFEVSVAPLVKSKWDQGNPYNLLTPTYQGEQLVTGCVATAMAQIMNYHEWPLTGVGSHSYTSTPLNFNLSANFGATTYDWANMPDVYTSSATDAQKNAVATLMFHCGVSVEMMYNRAAAGGSGAYSTDVPYALKTYFNYDRGAEYLYRDYTPHSEWVTSLKTEISAGRPVYYSGSGAGGGHAFVCDGYDASDKFHFNWGWSGSSDGYFELSALSPSDLGIGGGSGGFNYGQGLIKGIQKPLPIPGETSFRLMYEAVGSNKTSLASLSEHDTVIVYNLRNRGSADFAGKIGWALYKEDNSLVNYRTQYTISTSDPLQGGGWGWNSIKYDYSLPTDLAAGAYKLYPAYSVEPDPANPLLPTVLSGGVSHLTFNVAPDGSASIGEFLNAPDLSLDEFTAGSFYQNRIAEVKVKITNNGSDYIYDLRLALEGSEDEHISCPVSIGEGETKEFTFVIQPSVAPGSYTLRLYYETTNGLGNNWVSLGSKAATVLQVPAAPAISQVGAAAFLNANRVNKLAPNLKATIQNTGGYYDGEVIAFVFPASGNSSIASFGKQILLLEQGRQKEVVLNSEIGLEPGNYRAAIFYVNGNSWAQLTGVIPFTLVEPATDNSLASLTLSAGALSPAFDPATQDYTASVPYETGSITLAGTATDGLYATVVGNGTKPLAVGENTFTLVVTAENGGSRTYTLVVTREAQANSLNADWIGITGGPFIYDGTQHRPAFSVNDGTQDLTPGVDYTNATYGENKYAGTGSVSITGMGTYSGTVTKYFDVGKKALAATVTQVAEKVYDGTKAANVTLAPGNLVAGDEGAVILTATAEFADKNAGDSKPVAIAAIALSGAKAYNYEAPAASGYTGLTAKITPASYTYTIGPSQNILQGSSLTNIVAPAFGTGVIIEGNAEQVLGTLAWYTDAARTTPAGNDAFANLGSTTLYWKFQTSDANYTPAEKTGGPVTFTVIAGEAQDISFAMSSPVTKLFGDAAFTNEATNQTTGGGAIAYSGGNPSVATVDAASGQVSILGAGQTIITATAAMVPGQYRETAANYTLVVSPKPLTGAQVSVGGVYIYNGAQQTPAAADVGVSLDGQTLAYDVDYTFAGGGLSVGAASITVTGKGNYTGAAAGSFTIGKRSLTATATAEDKVYDATTVAAVTLIPGNVISGETVLLTADGAFSDAGAGAGKTASLSNIQLSGANAGNYNPPAAADIVAPTASITPANYIYVVAPTQSLKIGSTLDAINVAPAAGTGVNNETVGGTLEWFGDAQLQAPATDAAFAALGDVSLYWRFTATNPNYTDAPVTGVAVFTVTEGDPQPISFAESAVTRTYGDADFTIAATNAADDGGAIAYASSDPTVATVDATGGQVHIEKAGTSIIKALAAAVPGKYAATEASYTLTVNRKSLSEAVVEIRGTYVYNGYAQTPLAQDVSLSLDGKELRNPDDYTFALTGGGTAAGTATLAATGKGNYTGTATAAYEISKAPLSLDIASSIISPKTYDGAATANVASVAFAGLIGSETFSKEVDYTVTDAQYNSANVAEANVVRATVALIETGSVARNYTLADGAFSKAATINKATVAAGADQSVEVIENYAYDYEFNLESLLPTGITGAFGNVVYSVEAISNDAGVLGTVNYTSGTTLILPVQAVTAGQSASLAIRIASDNYADFSATIQVVTSSRKQVSISAEMAGGVYNGNAYTYTGVPVIVEFSGGETVTGLVLEILYENASGLRSADAPSDAGDYKLILAVPADHAVYFGSASFDFSITQRPIQIVADDKTAQTGDALPAFTYRVSGALT
jgi:hypothetical protein